MGRHSGKQLVFTEQKPSVTGLDATVSLPRNRSLGQHVSGQFQHPGTGALSLRDSKERPRKDLNKVTACRSM